MKRTVLGMLAEAAKNYGNVGYTHEKSDDGWIKKTFQEVETDSAYIGNYLISSGIKKEDKIAVLSEGRIGWVTGEYGILKAGAVSVPLSIKLLPDEVLFRLNHSDSKGIFISHNTFEKIAPIWERIEQKNFKIFYLDNDIEKLRKDALEFGIDLDKDVVSFSKMLEEGKAQYNIDSSSLISSVENIKESDIVTISYTSGTTGNPKGRRF